MQIRFYDASTSSYQTHEGEIVRSGSGRTDAVEYGMLYRLADGRYLGGVRHKDSGDLMTEVRIAAKQRDAIPARWR